MGYISTTANFRKRHPLHVLVVANTASADSMAVADAYMLAHALPSYRRLNITTGTADEITLANYLSQIRDPVLAYLLAHETAHFAVLCGPGMPLRVTGVDTVGVVSVDSALVYILTDPALSAGHTAKVANPYFGMTINAAAGTGRFYRQAMGMVLVTRLDGATRADALWLISRSMAARPSDGRCLFRHAFNTIDPNGGGVSTVETSITAAQAALLAAGFATTLDAGGSPTVYTGLMMAATWGPYSGYTTQQWAAQRFLPGAIGTVDYSTGAVSIAHDATGYGVAQLIAGGIAGVYGAVSEPLVDAIPLPDKTFGAYAAGLTLAESFYAGMRYLRHEGIVIGDPLCAPYRRGNE